MDVTAPPRRIFRSRTDQVIGGVAGGIGDYLGIDPVLVRIAFVVLGISGVGVLAYLIGWIAIPEAPADIVTAPTHSGGNSARFIVGAALVAAGVLYMVDWIFPIGRVIWPLLLIGVGATIVLSGSRR